MARLYQFVYIHIPPTTRARDKLEFKYFTLVFNSYFYSSSWVPRVGRKFRGMDDDSAQLQELHEYTDPSAVDVESEVEGE